MKLFLFFLFSSSWPCRVRFWLQEAVFSAAPEGARPVAERCFARTFSPDSEYATGGIEYGGLLVELRNIHRPSTSFGVISWIGNGRYIRQAAVPQFFPLAHPRGGRSLSVCVSEKKPKSPARLARLFPSPPPVAAQRPARRSVIGGETRRHHTARRRCTRTQHTLRLLPFFSVV